MANCGFFLPSKFFCQEQFFSLVLWACGSLVIYPKRSMRIFPQKRQEPHGVTHEDFPHKRGQGSGALYTETSAAMDQRRGCATGKPGLARRFARLGSRIGSPSEKSHRLQKIGLKCSYWNFVSLYAGYHRYFICRHLFCGEDPTTEEQDGARELA